MYHIISFPYYDVTRRSRCSCPRATDGESIRFNLVRCRTTRTNHSPPRLELQEPAQRHMVSRAQRETTKSRHMVSRAQRETTKSKHMHPNSPRLLDSPQELGAGSCTFEAKQYSAYRFRLPPTPGMRLIQFKLDHRGRQRTVLNRHRRG